MNLMNLRSLSSSYALPSSPPSSLSVSSLLACWHISACWQIIFDVHWVNLQAKSSLHDSTNPVQPLYFKKQATQNLLRLCSGYWWTMALHCSSSTFWSPWKPHTSTEQCVHITGIMCDRALNSIKFKMLVGFLANAYISCQVWWFSAYWPCMHVCVCVHWEWT